MTDPTHNNEPVPVEQGDEEYPCNQAEAQLAEYWRFHSGSLCPANCDLVYYRRKGWPSDALGPTPPSLIRWTDTGNASDILAWHPVYSAHQRRHRLASATQPPAREEVAWLIERRGSTPTWASEQTAGTGSFVLDPHRAYRWPSERHAWNALRRSHMSAVEQLECDVTEHIWIAASPAPPATGGER